MSALLLFGDTERSPAIRHEVPVAIMDPLLFAESDGRKYVLTSWLERERVARVVPEAEILDFFAYGYKELVRDGRSYADAEREVAVRAVKEIGIGEAIVPGTFPLALGDRLREEGIALDVDDVAVGQRRRAKSGAELEGIRAASVAAQSALAAAAGLLGRAGVTDDGRLAIDGQLLLAEHVRDALNTVCLEHDSRCPPDAIVASVWNGVGHDRGDGPLPAGLPIQIDLWPRHEESACFTDMTRTFVVGRPTPEHGSLIEEQQRLVMAALDDARAAIRPGASGREIYERTCELFESAGYETQRTTDGEGEVEGFQFALGHGVGLEVHEPPVLGLGGHEQLVAGDVVAVEPGLWDARIGGVRYEDLLLVTEDGCERLTQYPYSLTPGRA
jgi:Xaa-Pro aminopeptidase